MKASPGFTALALAAIAVVGCGRVSSPTAPLTTSPTLTNVVAAKAAYDPVIIPADFSSTIDNPLLPLLRGTVWRYRMADGSQTNTVTVTNDRKTVMGIRVAVVHDQVFTNGVLSEDTFDWYAQHKDGTVWYFGEDTRELDPFGNVITTQGSWEAGVNGGKPGILMLAHPKVGDSYRQEFMPGVVADMGKVLSLTSTASVPAGNFTDCLETVEWTPLEPGNRANKFYARGIGPVLELSNHGRAERLELVSFEPPRH